MKRVLEKIELLMQQTSFDLDIAVYQAEIVRLLAASNDLRVEEERVKDEMVQLDTRRRMLEHQMHITQEAATELGKDFSFASEKLGNEVECPICGAHYENSFAERFKIAADEDQLRMALGAMRQEYEQVLERIDKKAKLSEDLQSRMKAINEILETRQSDVKLHDILRSEGKKEVRVVLRGELDELNRFIGRADGEVEDATKEMKEFLNRKRVKEIKEFYLEKMDSYLHQLDVTELDEESYAEMDCKIMESGSDKPRALLAFYFAILKTIEKYSTAAFCPIVIDSARQQEQDTMHWKKMLEFMRDHRPTESQMIVGLVEDLGIDLGGDVIELVDERQLLQKADYERVAADLRPFIDKSLKQ